MRKDTNSKAMDIISTLLKSLKSSFMIFLKQYITYMRLQKNVNLSLNLGIFICQSFLSLPHIRMPLNISSIFVGKALRIDLRGLQKTMKNIENVFHLK